MGWSTIEFDAFEGAAPRSTSAERSNAQTGDLARKPIRTRLTQGRLDRKKFEAACGKATNSWKQLGAVVTISGVGFWDKPHTQNPHAPNFAILAKAGLLPAGWHHRYIGPARLQAGRGWHREIATTG